jgi:coenzyme F420-0:L-glutamate ligase / coenzyme F420-1:gamma-L-glutamate ligase
MPAPQQLDLGHAVDALFADRRSIRRYAASPVPDDVIRTVLTAAIAAPSAHNRQPWRFVVVQEPSAQAALATAMGGRLREARLRDGDSVEAIDADVARSYARLTGAPVLVLICLTMADMDRYPDTARSACERTMAVQGTAMATQNLLLAAHAVGLGACWMCAPLFCPDTVAATLRLPADWEPQGLVTLGYPAETGKPFRRRALADVVRYESART